MGGHALLRLGGALALADLAWGAAWRLIGSSESATTAGGTKPIGSLPYTQADATAGRMSRWLRGIGSWHELVAGLVLTAILSLLLGSAALVLSACALLVMWVGLLCLQRGKVPALVNAVLDVTLPWLLGTMVATQPDNAGALIKQTKSFALALAFTVLAWGIYHLYRSSRRRALGLWLGYAWVIVTLVGLREAWACAALATLFLPVSWQVLRDRTSDRATRAAAPWWLASMILAAFAARVG
jgi:hypothetical protein